MFKNTSHTPLGSVLRYISYYQEEAFHEDKCDQKKNLQNSKDNLVFCV